MLDDSDKIAWQGIADTWGQDLIDDLKRKSNLADIQKDEIGTVQALALEILAHQAPVNRLTMKQYRKRGRYRSGLLPGRGIRRNDR